MKKGVYTRFEAEMELKKAQDHLAAREHLAGFQLCNARITMVLNDQFARDWNAASGITFPARKAWELVGSLDKPMSFASGGFTISNLLFNAKVGRCTYSVSKAQLVSALETKI